MGGQLLRAARDSMLPQVRRARHTDRTHGTDSSGDERRVWLLPEAHDTIDTLLQQIHRPKPHSQLQAQIRIAPEEGRQPWNDEKPRKPPGHIDAQSAFWFYPRLHDGRLCLIEIRKDLHAALVEGGTVRSDRHTPRGALEQSHSQVLLEALHQVTHGRLR